jgi:predicted enzyme related to lactoylglutathione lyase
MAENKAGNSGARAARLRTIDTKLEVVVIPVSDVDRAKAFYESLGWRLDADRSADDIRVIQFTPPGSACSIQFGTNVTPAAPGSAQTQLLAVSDIDAAREDLVARGVEVSDVFHCSTGAVCRFRDAGASDRAPGPAPDHGSYGSYASFNDPDGNGWLFQEVTTRLPGRTDPSVTSFSTTSDLASALRRAAAAHGEHEKRIGEADADWPDWYADFMVRQQSGQELPTRPTTTRTTTSRSALGWYRGLGRTAQSSAARISSPHRSNFMGPIPRQPANSARVRGRASAIACRSLSDSTR